MFKTKAVYCLTTLANDLLVVKHFLAEVDNFSNVSDYTLRKDSKCGKESESTG